MDAVTLFLEKLVAFDLSPSLVIALAAIVEFLLRVVKSEKAMGIVHAVAGGIKMVSKIFALAASLVAKVAELSDKVLPQRTETPVL